MIHKIIYPNKTNTALWLNALFLLVLVITDYADPLTIVLAYFLETIIIGIIHVFKLGLVVKYGKKDIQKDNRKNSHNVSGFGLIFFFIFHYGFFIAVQLIFVFVFFGIKNPLMSGGQSIIDMDGLIVVLISIIITNLAYFYTNFWLKKKYEEYSPNAIFMKPYVRIFIQQFVVILSGFFYFLFPDGIATAIILIVLRFFVDSTMVSFNKDSEVFDDFVRKRSSSYDHYLEMKRKYQEFSE
jgi:hypothetical protein